MSKEFLQRTMVANTGSKVDTGVTVKPVNKETLSPFDSTVYKGATRVGQHPELGSPSNEDAFSGWHMTTLRQSPKEYLKKGQGMGGTANAAAAAHAREVVATRVADSHPPVAHASATRPNPPNTMLRLHYERGDLPVSRGPRTSLKWAVEPAKLDYRHYLPIFFSGLREVEEPYRLVAEQGISDMLDAPGAAEKVAEVVPQLVIPMKEALATRDERVLVRTCRVIGRLATLAGVGPALVPYFRQLLPVLSIFAARAVNTGDAMDFAQRKGHIGELIQDTLQRLELNGGPDAYINIKYMVPTYESAMLV